MIHVHILDVSVNFCMCVISIPYSAKRWRHKTLANQQNITLAKKTLANSLLAEMSGGHRETLVA